MQDTLEVLTLNYTSVHARAKVKLMIHLTLICRLWVIKPRTAHSKHRSRYGGTHGRDSKSRTHIHACTGGFYAD
eukprot:7486665-Alexandrium_andersonii.AAC.1